MLKKVSKKFLSILLCIAMVVAMVPCGVFTVWAESLNTLEIKNQAELLEFAKAVNAGNTYEGYVVRLCTDIDLKGVEWTPIGNWDGSVQFMGEFDGNEKTIKNLTVDDTDVSVEGNCYVGFFANTAQGSNIYDLSFEKVNIVNTKTSGYVGTLAGRCRSSLKNIYLSDINIIASTTCEVGGAVGSTASAGFCWDNVDANNVTITKKNTGSGSYGVGGLLGWMSGCSDPYKKVNTYENCDVTNVTITNENSSWSGGMWGGHSRSAAFMYVKNCTVTNVTISSTAVGSADNNRLGGFCAFVGVSGGLIENCSVTSGTISGNDGFSAGFTPWSYAWGQDTFKNCTVTNVDVTCTTGVACGFVAVSGAGAQTTRCIDCSVVGGTVTGRIASGFAGKDSHGNSGGAYILEGCTSSAKVNGTEYAAGMIAQASSSYPTIVNDCKFTGTVNGEGFISKGVITTHTDKTLVVGTDVPVLYTKITGDDDAPVEEQIQSAVAMVGTTKTYKKLSDAVAAANAMESGATITLLSDITLSETLTISKNITITGNKTITRGIAGTIFAVDKNATLTLDGGVVIDGGNDWTFDSENFYADLAAGKTLSTGAKESYATSEEGGLEATAAMITISGTNGAVVMNEATIQNNWGSPLFTVPYGADLIMNKGTLIQHIRGQFINPLKGYWEINGGKITDVHTHNTNGGLVDIRDSGKFTINGGEICYVTVLGLNANGNGIVAQVFGESAKLTINGGNIHDNASFSPGGGWGSVVYLNRGGDFEMNGGIIETTTSDHCTAFVSNTSTSIVLNEGTISVEESSAARFDTLIYGSVVIGDKMVIEGDGLSVILGDSGNTFENNGTISSNMQICHGEVTGNGTYNGDITIKVDDYFEFDGNVTISGGTWNGTITVEEGANFVIEGGIWNGKIIIKSGAEASFDVSGENASNVADILDNVIFEGEIDPEKIKLPQGVTYHSVTFKCEGKETLSIFVEDKQTVTIPDSISDLEGVVWYNGEEKFDFESNIEGDITLEAKKIFSITFDSDGGSKVETITQGYGSAISAPKAPTKEGYTFAGWDKEIPETMPAGDLEIKALWTINKHTVTFETNGGTKIETITLEYGSVIAAPKAPTKAGYIFDNWYVDGEVFDLEGHRLVGDITVEARYKVDKNNNGIEDTVDPAYTDSADDVFGRLRNILGMLVRIILSIIFMPFLIGSFI